MKGVLINKYRKAWIDALRGLAILLVVYGHCLKDAPEFYIFTSPFKMPLFFAISGYFLHSQHNDGGYLAFLKQLLRKVFVPWMILGLLPALILIPFKGAGYFLQSFLNLLSGKDLWFMPCFFIGEIIWYSILRICKKEMWIVLSAFMCFWGGLLLHNKGLMNYAMFNRALVVQPFFLIGYLFRQHENFLIKIKWHWIILGVFLYIAFCLFSMKCYPFESIDVHLNKYYNIPYCLLLIYLSCFLLFVAACKSNFNSSILSFIGQNTLLIYIWHSYVIGILVRALSLVDISLPSNFLSPILKLIWACFGCGICAIIFNRFLPEVVGKKKIKNNNE